MAHGISILNTANDLIITETFKNYCVVSSGALANSVLEYSNYTTLFIRPSALGARMEPCPDNWGHYSSSGSINYASCQLNPPIVSNHGLSVYTSSGELAFDSGRRMVCPVLQHIWYAPSNDPYASVTLTLPAVAAGKVRYIMSSCLDVYGIGSGFWYGTVITWTSDTSVTVDLSDLWYSLGPPGQTDFDTWGGNPYFLTFVDI